LHFEEAFDEEKTAYDKIKVCELRVNDLLSYVFALVFLVCFLQLCSIFVCSSTTTKGVHVRQVISLDFE
jgi:hypothetical protein